MSDDIGYQDGIESFEQWFRKFAGWITDYNRWIDQGMPGKPPKAPPIPLEGPAFNEADKNTWPWPKKFFDNTMRKLKDGHDAANPSNGGNGGGEPEPPPPPPPPNPWDSGFAPRAYNSVEPSGEPSARFNILINCTRQPDDTYIDRQGVVYDSDGRDKGGRTRLQVVELKPADMMDGKEPYHAYEWKNNTIGPNRENYPAASYER